MHRSVRDNIGLFCPYSAFLIIDCNGLYIACLVWIDMYHQEINLGCVYARWKLHRDNLERLKCNYDMSVVIFSLYHAMLLLLFIHSYCASMAPLQENYSFRLNRCDIFHGPKHDSQMLLPTFAPLLCTWRKNCICCNMTMLEEVYHQ